MMRYFRDLGRDAHLLLWADDGEGVMDHFAPEHDTWCIEKWRPFIHRISVANSIVTLIGDPRTLTWPASREQIIKQFAGYDAYIGSGYAPAILDRAGIRLDVFYPYATGVEGVGTPSIRNYLQG